MSRRPPSRGRPPRDEADCQALRCRILDAAIPVFARRGYRSTDVQEIADKAGVGKATVYRQFPTKEKLFIATVGHGIDHMHAVVMAEVDQADGDLDRIRRGILAYLRFWDQHPDLVELLTQERAEFPTRRLPYLEKREAAKELGRTTFRNLIAEGTVRQDQDPGHLIDTLFHTLYGTMYFNRVAGRQRPLADQATDIYTIFCTGCLAEPARRRFLEGRS